MSGRMVFITGTGTGVGKTIATAGIVGALRACGLAALPAKPLQTGAPRDDAGHWLAPDLVYTLAANQIAADRALLDTLAPFCFAMPASPHLAAAAEGRRVSVEEVARSMQHATYHAELLVAEGAGGLLVPLNDHETMADLITALGAPVIVVATTGLGTINHTLLTLAELKRRGASVVGCLYMQHQTPADEHDAAIERDNPATIARLSGVPTLGVIPPFGIIDNPEAFPHNEFFAALKEPRALAERLAHG